MTNQPMPCPPANTIHYPYVFLLSSVAALGGLLFGYDTAVIAGAIGYMTTYFELSAFWQGWAASCALIGCMIGAAGAGWISDRFGRKNALLVAAVLFTVSAIGSALPRNLTEFIIYRILGGVGVGIASMLSPLYIAEVAPARMRGALVTLNQLTIVGGMLVVYFVNASIASLGDSAWNTTLGWRWMFGSETLPAVLFFLLLLLVPESPRWLIQKNRPEEARAILYAIGGESHARQEIQDIQAILTQERGSLSQLIQPGFRTALLIGIGLAVLQQITGINVILYYAPIIFESMGLTASTALNQTVIIGVINLLFTLFAFLLVDRFGRKVLLLFSSAGMGLSLSSLG
ncbi:MAG: sugar porter family MFS transporter, partial [bacterium]|nr:sugar porter family MFS transporter [bacterium]